MFFKKGLGGGGLLEDEMWEKYLVCGSECVCKLRVWRADKGLGILSGYKETLLLAENNCHLVATSATIIKTDNSSTHHNQVIASSNAETPLINLVLIRPLHHNEANTTRLQAIRSGESLGFVLPF